MPVRNRKNQVDFVHVTHDLEALIAARLRCVVLSRVLSRAALGRHPDRRLRSSCRRCSCVAGDLRQPCRHQPGAHCRRAKPL